jgi:hypothetical protein
MQSHKKFATWVSPGRLLLLVFLGLLLVGGPVIASSGGPFDLSWWTADGGGGSSSGGSYTLSGTVGQADAGSHFKRRQLYGFRRFLGCSRRYGLVGISAHDRALVLHQVCSPGILIALLVIAR